MNGYDLRLMNSSFDRLRFDGLREPVRRKQRASDDFPQRAPVWSRPGASRNYVVRSELSLRHPIDYTRTRAGLKGNWQPFGDRGSCRPSYGFWDGTSLASGL